jgi:hypothetical protein
MNVKTFTGTHRAAVDKQVNDWLTESNVTVVKTGTAFKQLRERGWDAVAGKTTTRRALAFDLVRKTITRKSVSARQLDF